MIRIHSDDATVARTRLAVSALWELQTGFWMLHRNPDELPWPYTEWARQARRVLARLPASAPIRVYLDAGADLPDFLSPIPPTAAPSLVEELTALRETPEELIADHVRRHWPDGGPEWLRPYTTVSEHLSALLAARVAHRRRVGRRVLYGLKPAGVALLGLLSDEPVHAIS
ncbi:hypothetical protein [Micromonospora sp. NPDC049799]|uniref:hypothetical protein n=1 Tax=Micromonospora sp. NPDC049799 TaxID=3154741 RepID=UPI0033F16CAD